MSEPSSKNHPRTPASALDALVREAKDDLAPRVDDAKWSAMEARILASMKEDRSPLVDEVRASSAAGSGRARMLRVGGAVLAMAAGVALFVKKDPGPIFTGSAASQAELTSALRSTEGPGEVRVDGRPIAPGHLLRAGDLVEVDDARAVLERPHKVTWLLDHADADAGRIGRARVKSAGESLVLGLEDGAIEAQVTPVPSGEAFAVDVAAGTHLVRVAVHGTHLRVARTGSHVVVDLSEGVVSIGVPPRTGSTYGTLVTAPAHIELDAADLDHTLRIDHEASSVRLPVPLSPARESAASVANGSAPHVEPPQAAGGVTVPFVPATVPRPALVPRPAQDPSHVATVAKNDPSKPALPPREAIAAAVRECAAQRSRPENVRVSVSSKLTLRIAQDGDVETAQFEPPLLPEIQSCAATAIYKAKLAEAAGGSVTIPVDFSY